MLILIKSEFNKTFGGFFNDKLINNKGCSYAKDSFIFSLDEKQKFLQKNNDEYSFYVRKKIWICAFGQISANDIFISNNCNKNKLSRCNIGGSFILKNGMNRNIETTK